MRWHSKCSVQILSVLWRVNFVKVVFGVFFSQDDEEDDDDMDSLFSPNASSVASPMPSSFAPSLDGVAFEVDGKTVEEQKVDVGVLLASQEEKDAPARRTRQNLCLKDKPLEVCLR